MWRIVIAMLLLNVSMSACAERLDSVVAVVNDGVITQSELDDKVAAWHQQLQASRTPMPSEKELTKQVLDRLIDESLQLQIASHTGVEVDDAELDDAIGRIASQNHMTVEQMKKAIQNEGTTYEKYRDNVRNEMLMVRIQQQAVGRDIMVSNEQVEDYLKTALAAEKANYVFHLQNILVALPDEPTPELLKAGEAQSQALLDALVSGKKIESVVEQVKEDTLPISVGDLGARHLAELPDVFAKHVVNMKVGEFAGPLRTGNGFQVIKLVEVQKPDKHHEVEKTHVRHILIKQDASTTEEAAYERVNHLYEQLKSGKSFAELAKQYSVDAVSAEQGGDLGWMTATELTPAFAVVMEKLEVGHVSQPVKTNYGWHLIEVLDRQMIDDSDAYERQQVRQSLQQRKLVEAVESWQQHMRSTSYIDILKKELS